MLIGQHLSVGTLIDGKYSVELLLGQGGMGAVYRAIHLGTKRTVAIKIIHPQFSKNQEFIERFRREAEAAGRLRHPNVVDVTDFGFAEAKSGQIAYLVMEYLDGCTLAQVLVEEDRLPREWVVDILEQVCSAVDTAHRLGIVHRDLKPENIWLEPNHRGGYTIKVLDFGLVKLDALPGLDSAERTTTPLTARTAASGFEVSDQRRHTSANSLLDSTLLQPAPPEDATTILQTAGDESAMHEAGEKTRILNHQEPASSMAEPESKRLTAKVGGALTDDAIALTRVGSVMGTPLYMSPEQCRGEHLDARTDIYSLGVVAYRMLSGKLPFEGDIDQLIKAHTTISPEPISSKNRRVPRKMAGVVMSALSKKPDDRPQSAAGFASALRESAEGSSALLRKAVSLYSERFPTFLKSSFIAYIPLILLIALLNFDGLIPWARLSAIAATIVGFALVACMVAANLLAYSIVAAVVAPIVVQSIVAPLRPVRIKTAFSALAKRWRVFGITTIVVILMILAGSLLFVVPGLLAAVLFALYAPVVVMETGGVFATLRRARQLIRRSWSTALVITILQLALPVLVWYASTTIDLHIKMEGLSPKEFGFNIALSAKSSLYQLLNILIAPLTSIMTSLLYLKTRHAGGESLRDAIEQFDTIEIPRSKWQAEMRLRVASGVSSGRRGSSESRS